MMKPFINIDKIPYEQIVSSIKLGIFEWLHIAVALISENMEFLYCNKSFTKMYGLPEDVTGKRVDDYLLTDRSGMMESLKRHKVAVSLNQARSDVYGISMSYPIYDSKQNYRGVFVETVPMTAGKEMLSEFMDSMRTVELKTYSNSAARRKEEKNSGLLTFDSIIGRSAPMNELRRLGSRVAKSGEPILICGESGTGKEMVAQAVHMASPRADGPFVCVNCAALPADLMESELFGYESGSFTGAKSSGMKGKFEEANNGTIFLDEIGEMPLAVQAKLLRVLESGEIQKIGHKGQLRSNFRLVAATNRNLMEMVQHGQFREDLYHRLNVFELNIPPLRDRGDDIFLLIRFFIENSLGIERSLRIILSDELVAAIQRYSWHGNVRELKNIMTHALFLLGDDENVLSLQHLPPRFQRHLNPAPRDRIIAPDTYSAAITPPPAAVAYAAPKDERKMLQEALVRYQYNKVLMAKELGISRSKLYRDLRKYKLLGNEKP
jgi:transcriptional regulator with PAS, ATPase and Fis domain